MSKINPLFFALGIPVVVIVILVAIVVPRMGGGGRFADLTPFSVETYRRDWATLQGNSYRLECQVEQQLAFVEGRGRVLAVKPISKDPVGRIPSSSTSLPFRCAPARAVSREKAGDPMAPVTLRGITPQPWLSVRKRPRSPRAT